MELDVRSWRTRMMELVEMREPRLCSQQIEHNELIIY